MVWNSTKCARGLYFSPLKKKSQNVMEICVFDRDPSPLAISKHEIPCDLEGVCE